MSEQTLHTDSIHLADLLHQGCRMFIWDHTDPAHTSVHCDVDIGCLAKGGCLFGNVFCLLSGKYRDTDAFPDQFLKL